MSEYADWISAGATAVAAVAAIIAAFFTAKAAGESRKSTAAARRSADAAQQSAELQRPRPVLVIKWNWPLNPQSTGSQAYWSVTNVGDSPAFNVAVSPLYLPGENQQSNNGYLKTNTIRVIPAGPPETVVQFFETSITGESDGSGPVNFVRELAKRAGSNDASVQFSLTYLALDGRAFNVDCELAADHGDAILRPRESWLGTERKAPSSFSNGGQRPSDSNKHEG